MLPDAAIVQLFTAYAFQSVPSSIWQFSSSRPLPSILQIVVQELLPQLATFEL